MARPPTAFERVVAGDVAGPRPSLGTLAGLADGATNAGPSTATSEDRAGEARPRGVGRGEGERRIVIVSAAESFARGLDDALRSLDGRTRGVADRDDGALVLTRGKDGTLRYASDSLVATIREDGAVDFVAKPDVNVVPGPFGGNGRTAQQNAAGDPTLGEVLPSHLVPPHLDRALQRSGKEGPGLEDLALIALVSGQFDLNAPLLRLAGSDALDDEKRCFLRDTAALREEMADDFRARAAKRSFVELEGRLAGLVADPLLSVADKKRAVLDLWDDCALDDAGGRRARRVIDAFVRESMPPGSTLAFSDEELAAFNAGRPADACFAPYG
jgi:hypothetical protein